jgi:hypothetical protein
MNLSVDKIVTITSGKIVQSGESHNFSGMASLDEATAEDVSFLSVMAPRLGRAQS